MLHTTTINRISAQLWPTSREQARALVANETQILCAAAVSSIVFEQVTGIKTSIWS